MTKTYAPPYYGGKQKLAPWIASILPWSKNSLYVEPFAGMASVLLARQPVSLELINDLNKRIITWWEAVRDEPEQFSYMIDNTPRSRHLLEWSYANVDNEELSMLKRALAFHTIITQTMHHGDSLKGGTGAGHWQVKYNPHVAQFNNYSNRILPLANRLRHVQLDCRPAMEVLERTKKVKEAVLYVDPPYASADRSPYNLGEINTQALADVLLAQEGKVAISGYEADGWNKLLPDWTKHTIDTKRFQINMPVEERTEVLWTNYQSQTLRLF